MKKYSLADALKIAAVSLFMIGSPLAAAAKYYKWVDENGTTHYTAQPPADGQGEIIRVKSGTSSDKEAAMKRLEDRRAKLQEQAEQRANPEEDPQAKADKENAEITKRNCEIYRKNLTTMQQNSRVRMMGDDGNMRVIPEEERQAKMKTAQDYIGSNCN